jgi:hypothetical protein
MQRKKCAVQTSQITPFPLGRINNLIEPKKKYETNLKKTDETVAEASKLQTCI